MKGEENYLQKKPNNSVKTSLFYKVGLKEYRSIYKWQKGSEMVSWIWFTGNNDIRQGQCRPREQGLQETLKSVKVSVGHVNMVYRKQWNPARSVSATWIWFTGNNEIWQGQCRPREYGLQETMKSGKVSVGHVNMVYKKQWNQARSVSATCIWLTRNNEIRQGQCRPREYGLQETTKSGM
jgi:hypothetical protein